MTKDLIIEYIENGIMLISTIASILFLSCFIAFIIKAIALLSMFWLTLCVALVFVLLIVIYVIFCFRFT